MAVRANDGSWVIHFGVFEADLRAGELRRNGSKVKLQEQPFQILAMLLERPGEIVTREELRARLWSADTFVDFDHGLNSAIRRLRLAQIGALRVISRTSAMRYKGTKKSLPEIARELHVDAVVEGAVMWVGARVRISAQLIEAQTDHHLWAASYERDLRDVLSMQEEVTRAIVSEIRVKLTAQEQARLASTRLIDPDAYRLCLKGRYYFYKLKPEAMQKAIEYFQQALEKDPAYALAYAGLADTYNALAFFTVFPPREVVPKAKAAAVKALEIDANLAILSEPWY